MSRLASLTGLVSVALLLAACGADDDGATAAPPVPANVVASSVANLTGVVGTPVTPLPSVRVTSATGTPVPAANVTFQVTGGGGQVLNPTVPTNDQGIATVGAWILGAAPGTNTLTATVGSLAPVSFTAASTTGPAAKIAITSGDDQSGDLGTPLASPLTVRVTDALNNPVAGAAVTFAISSGSGTLSAATGTTDVGGLATTALTLTGIGSATVSATTGGAASVVFRANTGPSLMGQVLVPSTRLAPFAAVVRAAGAVSSKPGAAIVARPPGQRLTPKDAITRLDTRGRLIVSYKPAAFGLPLSASSYRTAPVQHEAARAYEAALAPLEQSGVLAIRAISPAIAAVRVQVADGEDPEAVAAQLRRDPRVLDVESEGVAWALYSGVVPLTAPVIDALRASHASGVAAVAAPATERYASDVLLEYQLWNYGMIDAPRAWTTTTGSATVRVAIVDTGIHPGHPAVAPLLSAAAADHFDFTDGVTLPFAAPQPICGTGQTFQTFRGTAADIAAPRNLPQDPRQVFIASSNATCWNLSDAGSHGTHVAGTVGSAANDGIGGTGVNWNVSLMSVRVLGITGQGFFFDIAQGILFAGGLPATYTGAPIGATVQTAPADIINLSLGGSGTSTVLRNAIAAAAANSLIIVAAGNSASDAGTFIPAAYPEVMTVAALAPNGGLASYSNVGLPVDIAAPGGDFRMGLLSGVVSSTVNYVDGTANYSLYQGTSMAAPHVTGVAALVKAVSPGLSPSQLRQRLEHGAVDLGAAGYDPLFGAGVVNARNSVTGTSAPAAATRVQLVNATTGAVTRVAMPGADGRFSFANLPGGQYVVVAGQDEGGDGLFGVPGRRFNWFGAGGMTPFAITTPGVASVALTLGPPVEAEPNDALAQAHTLVVNSWVAGNLGGNDTRDVYAVQIPTAGTYTFETSGVTGACGKALETDTMLRLLNDSGAPLHANDDTAYPTASYPGTQCSRISTQLTPGRYYIEVTGFQQMPGQYRLHVRSGG